MWSDGGNPLLKVYHIRLVLSRIQLSTVYIKIIRKGISFSFDVCGKVKKIMRKLVSHINSQQTIIASIRK